MPSDSPAPHDLTNVILRNCGCNRFSPPVITNSEMNYEPSFEVPSFYYTLESLSNLAQKEESLSVLNLNAQCLHAKIDSIRVYLDNLSQNGCNFDFLCIQETWLSQDDDISQVRIAGYHLLHRGKSASQHGGTAVYIKDKYVAKIVHSTPKNFNWEGLFVEVKVSENQNCLLGCIYRPPRNLSTEVENFISNFSQTIDHLSSHNNPIICGDFNFNLLMLEQNPHTCDFLDTIVSLALFPAISIPTRFSNNSATLIDNILVSFTHSFEIESGVLLEPISDHQACFLLVKSFKRKKEKHTCKHITITQRKPNFIENVRRDLSNVDFRTHLHEDDDPNVNYRRFEEIITGVINKYTETKRVRFKKYKHKRTPWITTGILRSIKFRDRLYIRL